MEEVKKFKDIKVGDYLYCATCLGHPVLSEVHDVAVKNKVVMITHAWYSGEQKFNLNDSKKVGSSFLNYVATNKEELIELLQLNLKRIEKEIATFEKLRKEAIIYIENANANEFKIERW